MKRMTLVDKTMLDRLREKKVGEQMLQPEMSSMIEIQQQIEGVLKSSKLSDEEKVNLLDRARSRFDKLKDALHPGAVRANPPPPPLDDMDEPIVALGPQLVDRGAGPPPPDSIFDAIPLPQQFAQKFDRLKNFLNAKPNLISNNALKEVILDGKRIPNSNFHDLIRNMYVRNEAYNLTGNHELLSLLKREKLPKSYLSNHAVIENLGTPPPSPTAKKEVKHAPLSSSSSSSYNSADNGNQTGKGAPPGKRPRILLLYR